MYCFYILFYLHNSYYIEISSYEGFSKALLPPFKGLDIAPPPALPPLKTGLSPPPVLPQSKAKANFPLLAASCLNRPPATQSKAKAYFPLLAASCLNRPPPAVRSIPVPSLIQTCPIPAPVRSIKTESRTKGFF